MRSDLLGGQIKVAVDALPQNIALMKSGRLRALAVTAPQRSAQPPGVPSAVALGLPALVAQNCRETPLRQIGNVLDWVARDPDLFVASAVADSGRGVEDASAVRLVLRPDMARDFGDVVNTWSARLQRREVVPEERYDGPELAT